eukprot:3278371-Rhodomonas_salina.1
MEVQAAQLQIVNVSVSGDGSGTFKLRIGGKASLVVSIEATEDEVAAAVLELLSNCEGDMGLGRDAAGNTFDCFQAATPLLSRVLLSALLR